MSDAVNFSTYLDYLTLATSNSDESQKEQLTKDLEALKNGQAAQSTTDANGGF